MDSMERGIVNGGFVRRVAEVKIQEIIGYTKKKMKMQEDGLDSLNVLLEDQM